MVSKEPGFPFDVFAEECGGGGDCLFHSVAQGLGRMLHRTITAQTVRDWVAQAIVARDLLHNPDYQSLVTSRGLADAPLKQQLAAVKADVRTMGRRHEGTDVDVRLLVSRNKVFRALGVGVVVFSTHGGDYTTVITHPVRSTLRYLLLFNYSDTHWRLAHVSQMRRGHRVRTCWVTPKMWEGLRRAMQEAVAQTSM